MTPWTQATPAVVIVNYKTGHLLAGSLVQLAEARRQVPGLRVVIVDNHSPDDSVALIRTAIARQGCGDWVELICHPSNAGFSAGNNVGIRHALSHGPVAPTHFFILNPDAQVRPGSIEALLEFSAAQGDRALIGGLLVNEADQPRSSAFRFHGPLTEFQRGAHLGLIDRLLPARRLALPPGAAPHRADWVSGAAFLVPRAIVEQVGLMDEGYFLYFEEVDYMRQVCRQGFEIWSLPAARVMHLAGAATGIVGGQAARGPIPDYWYQSWHRYFFKNHGALYGSLCALAWLSGRLIHTGLGLLRPARRRWDGHRAGRFLRLAWLGQAAPRGAGA
jgi:N-acetylglucosaminyl-diphospho-decaprenol L-rhamnosyltransferase